MTEMIGMPAMTIHRLLGPEPRVHDGELYFGFTMGDRPRTRLTCWWWMSFPWWTSPWRPASSGPWPAGTRVLIVGDHYQFPSVGPGAVLRDLLAAGVPSYELTEIKRNTGDIVQACHAIKDGRPAIPSPRLDPENGLNFRHIEESDPFRRFKKSSGTW